jgi:peroxisomal 2,4-dienoyl-CoA reductase
LDRLAQAAEELSKKTGNTCIPTQADVRNPAELKEAVRKTIEKFGKIDFVICGKPKLQLWTNGDLTCAISSYCLVGAAGNFLAPLSGLSENAFRTVIEIDTVWMFYSIHLSGIGSLFDQLGTFNTFKATIPYVRQSHGSYLHVSAALHYRGKANPLGASTGN